MSHNNYLVVGISVTMLLVVLSGGCTGGEVKKEQLLCPELSNAILYGYDEQAETWVAEKIDYSTETEKLVFDERVEWRTSTPKDRGFPNLHPNMIYYMCDSGSRHIELGNKGDYKPDYVYCGDFIRPIVLYKVDANGNIINDVRTSVEIIFDSKTMNYVATRCGTYQLSNAVQTEEPPFEPPVPSTEPATGELTTTEYVYDDKLGYGFEYPGDWEIFMEEGGFPDKNIKKVVSLKKKISRGQSQVFVEIGFMVTSATSLETVRGELKKEVEMSGLPILNETAISVNDIDGYDIRSGIPEWKLRQVVFFSDGTAYIFRYSSQDEFYRMYEEAFDNIINSFDIE